MQMVFYNKTKNMLGGKLINTHYLLKYGHTKEHPNLFSIYICTWNSNLKIIITIIIIASKYNLLFAHIYRILYYGLLV